MAFATSVEEAASIESRHERSQKTVQGILDAFVRKRGIPFCYLIIEKTENSK